MKKIKYILFIGLMLLLWIPLIQSLTGFFKEPKLSGAFTIPSKPEFSIDSLKSFQYQKHAEDYLNNTFGLRGFFVKVKNSWEYLLFKQINVEDQVEGEKGYIYSKSSIELNIGHYYNGSIKNANTIRKINFLKDGVEKRGGHFLAIFAPSKEVVLPEFLPEEYRGIKADSCDYFDIISGYKKYNIPYLDFSEYLKKMKEKSEYPLFTKTGFHWSSIAAGIAQDSLLSYMQKQLNYSMPKYTRKGVEWSDTVRDSEADFEEPMNLLFSLNQPKYVYPKFEMVNSSLKNKRPKVIIIGDSFFWQLKNLKMLQYIFSEDSKYWYYFAKYSFPLSDVAGLLLKDINVMEEINSADYVILVGSYGTTGQFPFGITDYYYDNICAPPAFEGIKDYIKSEPIWLEKLTRSALLESCTSEEKINYEAKGICRDAKTFNLLAKNNKYVCADAAKNDIIIADKEIPSTWELFTEFQLGGNHVALCSFQNKFLSTELNKDMKITANRKQVQGWEIFTKIDLGNNEVAYLAVNGKYLSVDSKTMQLFANATSITEKETFLIKKVNK